MNDKVKRTWHFWEALPKQRWQNTSKYGKQAKNSSLHPNSTCFHCETCKSHPHHPSLQRPKPTFCAMAVTAQESGAPPRFLGLAMSARRSRFTFLENVATSPLVRLVSGFCRSVVSDKDMQRWFCEMIVWCEAHNLLDLDDPRCLTHKTVWFKSFLRNRETREAPQMGSFHSLGCTSSRPSLQVTGHTSTGHTRVGIQLHRYYMHSCVGNL